MPPIEGPDPTSLKCVKCLGQVLDISVPKSIRAVQELFTRTVGELVSSGMLLEEQVKLLQGIDLAKLDLGKIPELISQVLLLVNNQIQSNRSLIAQVAKVNEELRKKVASLEKDNLTGLYNRHRFDTEFDNLALDYIRNGNPFSMAVLDLDFFKSVNDNYGHDVGDDVLKFYAKILVLYFGNEGVFRFGGEELVILFRGDKFELFQKLEEVRKIMSSKFLRYKRDKKIVFKVPFSAGVSEYSGEGKKQFFIKTDRQLYISKNTGRDRITVG